MLRNGLSILLHGFISLPEAKSCDKIYLFTLLRAILNRAILSVEGEQIVILLSDNLTRGIFV